MGKFGRNIVVRTLSGAGLLVVVLAAVFISEYTFAALMAVIAGGSMWEFYRIAARSGAQPQRWYATIVGVAAVLAGFMMAAGHVDARLLTLLIPLVAAMFVIELYRKKEQPLTNVSVSLGGVVYAALPMVLISFISFMDGSYNQYVVLAIIFTVWVNDIFAYLTGVAFGRHKFFERISPKKSWEGFFGGLIFAIAFAVLCGHLLGGNLWFWGGLGAVTVAGAVLGDLVESLFKRAADMKDSGSIIPGHGGFMDRFDALLFAIPLVYVYFIIFTC